MTGTVGVGVAAKGVGGGVLRAEDGSVLVLLVELLSPHLCFQSIFVPLVKDTGEDQNVEYEQRTTDGDGDAERSCVSSLLHDHRH